MLRLEWPTGAPWSRRWPWGCCSVRPVFTTAFVPEPASLVLLGTGVLGLLGSGWHHRKRVRA